jgi:hypothetical protein
MVLTIVRDIAGMYWSMIETVVASGILFFVVGVGLYIVTVGGNGLLQELRSKWKE